ncbi:MAG: SulP family inorganic anion transporter [Acidimicrobiales bacterium]
MTDPAAVPAAPASTSTSRRGPFLQGILPFDRSGLSGEVVAGLTLAALGIPEVMGYTKIAGMPVVTGLYTILVPLALFAILGSSRHLVVGADSATAAMMAAGIGGLAAAGSSQYVALAGITAITTGVVLIVARLVHLGFLADFLSRSVLVGFLTGVGIQVAMGQVGGMLGISGGTGGTLRKFGYVLGHLGDADRDSALISVAVLAIVLGAKAIDRRIPGALIAVVGMIAASWAWDFAAKGVSTLGPVPGGLPSVSVPHLDGASFRTVLATVAAIVLVILAQSAATSRAYAAKYQEPFSEDVDLVGLGAANIAAGLTGTFVVNGSPTKTQMVDGAGGRSQVASLVTSGIVLIVLLFLTKPLEYMPNAVLAAVVFLIGVELIDIRGLRKVLAVRTDEFAIAVVTAAAVVVLGVEQGVVLAIVLSILDYVRRGYLPSRTLVVVSEHGHLRGRPMASDAEARPGLVVYRFGADLFYANANGFSEDVRALATRPGVRWVCVDGAAVADIDYSGWQALLELRTSLEAQGQRLVVADLAEPVRDQLRRYGYLTDGAADAYEAVGDVLAAYDADAAGG